MEDHQCVVGMGSAKEIGMKKVFALLFVLMLFAALPLPAQKGAEGPGVVTVPFILDHNRMLVEAEIQRKDGSWRKALLWVDTGNPDFLISEALALELGIMPDTGKAAPEIPAPENVRVGGKALNFEGVKTVVGKGVQWMFNTMHNDGNLPSSVLKNYHVVFDYPQNRLTIAEPGILKPRGTRSPAAINPANGILQMDAVIDGEQFSFAFDNGASCSFVPDQLVEKWRQQHPGWATCNGAVGCANIWGWWPGEENWPMVRLPEIRWGNLDIMGAVIVGLPPFFRGNTDIGTRYSKKTARPVNGFLGPNVFKNYRIEIVYHDSTIYFEKVTEPDVHDMDIVGLTLKPLDDGRYEVIGVIQANGKPGIIGVRPGDILIQVGNLKASGAMMGRVTDALRGKPGEKKVLTIEREGTQLKVEACVVRFL